MNLEAQWIVGFVDGEGTFHIQINKKTNQVLPEFVISQHMRSENVLYAIKDYFDAGVVRKESNKPGETGRQYRVRDVNQLRKIIIPFFEKHSLKTTKHIDFLKFRDVLLMMERKEHLTLAGKAEIEKIRETMNTKGHRAKAAKAQAANVEITDSCE